MTAKTTLRAAALTLNSLSLAMLLSLGTQAQAAASTQQPSALKSPAHCASQGDIQAALQGLPSNLQDAGVVLAFYQQNQFSARWCDAGLQTHLLSLIKNTALDGLQPEHYHASAIEKLLANKPLSLENKAVLDILLTDAYQRLYHDYRNGVLDHSALVPTMKRGNRLASLDGDTLAEHLGSAEGLAKSLNELVPMSSTLRRMRTQLQFYTAIEAMGGWPTVAAGETLKVGMTDPRVAVLRERLSISGDYKHSDVIEPNLFDEALAESVKHFQMRHALTQDAAVGPATLAALNESVGSKISKLKVNMDRKRFSEFQYGDRYISVNVAAQTLSVVKNGEEVWQTRTVVGKAKNRTPLFSDEMDYLVLNPYWYVPRSILRKEILPTLKRNPANLKRKNMQLINGSGRSVSAWNVNWSQVSSSNFPYTVRQLPGKKNALGLVKFIFPNQHAVYLHDTPQKRLFDRSVRAFSHGCVRVENPLKLAEVLLAEQGWSASRIQAQVDSGKNRRVYLEKKMPVHLFYHTASVSDDNWAMFYPDIYKHDNAALVAYNDSMSSSTQFASLLLEQSKSLAKLSIN